MLQAIRDCITLEVSKTQNDCITIIGNIHFSVLEQYDALAPAGQTIKTDNWAWA